jgi:hypothetical protein
MFTELEIQNFRGLRDVKLTGLKSANLIVGGNDTGKTSILEALVLLLGDGSALRNLPITFRSNQSGNQTDDTNDRENFWSWLFYDRDAKNKIAIRARLPHKTIEGVISDETITVATEEKADPHLGGNQMQPVLMRKDSRSFAEVLRNVPKVQTDLVQFGLHQFSVLGGNPPDGFRLAVLSTRATNPVQDAENYNQVALLADGERRIEEIMREIEPRVRRLRYAKLPNTTSPLVFVDIGLSRAVPSPQMGQAFNRLLHIYTHVLANKANVLLVDEIENGIFSESMPKVWNGLLTLCEREGLQVFATTHSRECVMAAHEAEKERGKQELSVQRLQVVTGNVEAVSLTSPHLEVASEMGLEVRS